MSKAKKNNKTTQNVLKRRLRIKKTPSVETVDVTSPSNHILVEPAQYYDSDIWAFFEATFPDHAKAFFAASGADKYNHDALDLEIDKQYEDELEHYREQRRRHIKLINAYSTPGLKGEKIIVDKDIERLEKRLAELEKLEEEKQALYDSYSKKAW